MTLRSPRTCLRIPALKAAAAAVAMLACLIPQAVGQTAEGAFHDFDGAWTGSGRITMKDGTNESIRCRVNYVIAEGGRLLTQDLRCASDSYKFELQTNVANNAGAITGQWNETTRQVVGTIKGRLNGGDLTAVATAPAVTANLAVSTHGNQQSVSIKSPGSEVTEVSITLRRSAR